MGILIMMRHLLPNAMSPIIVAATCRVATSIITGMTRPEAQEALAGVALIPEG